MPYERRQTAAEIVKAVMGSIGLTEPSVVSSSTDKTVLHFWRLLKEEGKRLIGEHDWQVLHRTHQLSTVIGQTEYDLPEDWHSYEADSQWNRSTIRPVLGPIAEFQWQALKARASTGTPFTMLFRIENDQIILFDEPDSVQQVYLPYKSRAWVEKADASLADTVSDDDDTVLYDAELMKAALDHAWHERKGFDTTKTLARFKSALDKAKGADTPGRTLSMVPNHGYPYLGLGNVPETGFGS